jgi:hypothetical protein
MLATGKEIVMIRYKFAWAIFAFSILAASSVMGQPPTFNIIWMDGAGGSPDWYPLTYDCAGDGPTLEDGTVVQLWQDIDNSRYNPGIPTHSPLGGGLGWLDVQPTVGDGQGEINRNQFVFNSAEIERSLGSFSEQGLFYNGGGPGIPGVQAHYLVIACPDGEGGYLPLWVSSPFNVSMSIGAYIIQDQSTFPFLPAWSDCSTDCAPPLAPHDLTIQLEDNNLTLRWDPGDYCLFRIFSLPSPHFPFPYYEAETSQTTITLPNAIQQNQRFFYVVGEN